MAERDVLAHALADWTFSVADSSSSRPRFVLVNQHYVLFGLASHKVEA